MVKQVINIKKFWKVIVFYSIEYKYFSEIERIFEEYSSIDDGIFEEIWDVMMSHKAKGVTYSNLKEHVSIVLFNKHCVKRDYLNTLVHEAEHVKQAMLKAYQVEDAEEPPAYTIGYLVMKMWEVWKELA